MKIRGNKKAKIEMLKKLLKYILGLIVFVGVIFVIVIFASQYSQGFQTKGAGPADNAGMADVSASYTYTDNYNYSDKGVLVYTSAVNSSRGDATVKKGNIIIYKLTVTNPHQDVLKINLKFSIPSGFIYKGMVNTSDPRPSQSIGLVGPADLTWVGYNALVGESSISFQLQAP